MPELMYLNGSVVSPEEAKVPVLDRGFLFGDGLYEVVRVYDNEPFCLKEHLDRFYFGINGLEMPFPYSKDQFEALLRDFIKQSNLGWASLYWEVSRGAYETRTHYFTDKMTSPTIFIMTRYVGPQPAEKRERGIKVSLQPDVRWLKCCYKTVNLVANCMAMTRAYRVGASEAVLYRSEDHVTEGAASSLFIVKNGELWTHPESDLILSGITRGQVLKLAEKLGIPYKEKIFGVRDLLEADEAFITGTVVEINPIVYVDDRVIGSGKPGPVTQKVIDAYLKLTGQR